VRECPECGSPVEPRFHYCPWCAAPQRRKLVDFFWPHQALDADRGKALRVSRYLGTTSAERHVRFSVWNESGVAEAAVSLDEDEARRLVSFVASPGLQQPVAKSDRSRLLARFRAPAADRLPR
jgi:hypothetical protein